MRATAVLRGSLACILFAVAGCATSQPPLPGITQVGPYEVRMDGMIPAPAEEIRVDPVGVVALKVDSTTGAMFTQPISDPSILSAQANTWLQVFAGPNKVSEAVLDGQNVYRDAEGTWNNPWQALFALRDR